MMLDGFAGANVVDTSNNILVDIDFKPVPQYHNSTIP